MKRNLNHMNLSPSTASMTTATTGKSKLVMEEQDSSGMDELLAALGYKVKSSDMAEIASKIEQLEEALGTQNIHDDVAICSDTVHYNPSDISNWLENMLSELNPNPSVINSTHDSVVFNRSAPVTAIVNESFLSPAESSTIHFGNEFDDSSCFDYDLKAIPGKALFPQSQTNKKMKQSDSSGEAWGIVSSPSPAALLSLQNNASTSLVTRPVVLIDSQDTGVRLVHMLMACGDAIQQNNLKLAETLVKQIGHLAPSQAGAMRKVATYFAEAIARKIYRYYPQETLDQSLNDVLQMHFYEACPYLKFAHFTANQAILEAFSGKKQVHVIDFSMNQGMQWPVLMQALAVRPGGPPAFRLTGIGPPASDNTDRLQEVGWKLAQFAETMHVEFEYRGFVTSSLADLDSSMLDLRASETEAVAVNSVFELHRLLARPGAFEKVLDIVKQMKPAIVTIAEQEANHNSPIFSERFNESLHYYSTLFDSLEGSVTNQDKIMSEVYLGRQICNLVACEGLERVERHEPLTQWQNRFKSAGFESVHLGSNAFKQASMSSARFAGCDGYRVEEKDGCLMLGWHTRPLITSSAWQVCSSP